MDKPHVSYSVDRLIGFVRDSLLINVSHRYGSPPRGLLYIIDLRSTLPPTSKTFISYLEHKYPVFFIISIDPYIFSIAYSVYYIDAENLVSTKIVVHITLALSAMSSIKKLLIGATLGLVGVGAFKPFPKNTLGPLAGIGNQFPLGSKHDTVATHPKADAPGFKCDLAKPLDPSADGLYSSHDWFSNKRAIKNLIRRHQPLVRIPSVCYDDLGDFDDDRWEPFYYIPRVLEDEYPLM